MQFVHSLPFGILTVTFGEQVISFTLIIDDETYETVSELPRIDEDDFVEIVKFYTQKPEVVDCFETKKMRVISLGFSLGSDKNGESELVRIVEFRIPTDPSADTNEPSDDKYALPDKEPTKTPATPEAPEKKVPNAYARRTLLTWFSKKRNVLNIAHARFLIDNDISFGRKCDNVAAIKRSIKALNVTISTATEVRDRLEEVLVQNKSD